MGEGNERKERKKEEGKERKRNREERKGVEENEGKERKKEKEKERRGKRKKGMKEIRNRGTKEEEKKKGRQKRKQERKERSKERKRKTNNERNKEKKGRMMEGIYRDHDQEVLELIDFVRKLSKQVIDNYMALSVISIVHPSTGTAYHQCLQGRKKAMKLLKTMLKERQNSPRRQCVDFFDSVIEELKKERPVITETIALDLMFVLLFASFETTSLALTVAMKLLTDNPRALEELKEEHEAILKNRENPDSGITWNEYKSMSFTFQVINETVRLANIVPGIFRKAMQDIKIKGFTIPAGWGVMVCPPAVHLNPETYEDPLAFNPWRWKDKLELSGGSKHFMALGGGLRFCVGADFTKLQMAIFLHCLVTKWKAIRGGNAVRTPGLGFPDGYHMQFFPKTSC
ncbi:Cytochrome P450 87A3 [Cocos nucifera]|uniref:Cytochrome P450 87A3 n=1 Tax=Cocos nucifera TaxID=13894 RepID=A0A8K0IF99_COCNU|nr:Cytochrome P450 87A3 [Cocos nucifera]